MESIGNKLKSQMINGEHCLSLSLSSELVLHHFHLGMVTSQKKLNVVPMYCGYVSGVESIVFNVSGLIPIKQYLYKKASMEVHTFLALLGSTILNLMEYHLNPGNFIFQMDHIYWDNQQKNLKLIYLPIENEQETTASQLESTIIEFIQIFQTMKMPVKQHSSCENDIVSLLIDFRHTNMSIRQMALRISTLALETNHMTKNNDREVLLDDFEYTEQVGGKELNPQGMTKNLGNIENSKDINYSKAFKNGRERKDKKVNKDPKDNKDIKLSQIVHVKSIQSPIFSAHKKDSMMRSYKLAEKLRFLPVSAAILVTLVSFVWAPFEMNTKIGIGLISLSLGLYATLKIKNNFGRTFDHTAEKSIISEPNPKENTATADVHRPPVTNPVESSNLRLYNQQIKEETVKIDTEYNNLYLMLRTEGDPRFIPIQSDLVSIGRNPAICDVLLDEAGIGRLHAELHRNGDQIYLKDLHSVNGTFLNGKRIITNQYCELKKGDQIKIGSKELVLT